MVVTRWRQEDVGGRLRLSADAMTLDDGFANIATALTASVSDPAAVTARGAVHIVCANGDHVSLLARWMRAVCHEMADRRVIFGSFQVHLRNGTLAGVALGEAADEQQLADLNRLVAIPLIVPAVVHTGKHWHLSCEFDPAR